MPKTVHDYIVEQEKAWKLPIDVNENWRWNMFDHITISVLYKNSQLHSGGDKEFKPVKNITRPLLNLQYRAMAFDLKDIIIFIDSSTEYFKSLLVRKYHEMWAKKNDLDTFINRMIESYTDFGGVLVKDVDDVKPEVVPLQSLAFCDQTDILSGPICIKHFYSPDQLLAMKKNGWGNPDKGASCSLEETIILSRQEKQTLNGRDLQITKTPGKYIEVYEIHGTLPENYLEEGGDPMNWVPQLQIVCFYTKPNSADRGHITLYKSLEKKSPFKFLARDEIYGRALGLGGAEELFDPQVWTNYSMIRKFDMLDAASKMIMKSTDPMVATRNRVRNMENLEIVELAPGTDLTPVNTEPVNIAAFDNAVKEWGDHAQMMAGATDALMGETPAAGTPFVLQNMIAQQGQGLHAYRQGKIATFLGEIYRDWVLPRMQKEITKGHEFLAELDLDDVNFVSENLVTAETNKMVKATILAGQNVPPQMVQAYQQLITEEFKKKGGKHFIKILEGEFKNSVCQVNVNIAGKQTDLADKVNKLTSVFRTILANPYILKSPPIAKLFNQIIELSGLDPIDLSQFDVPPIPTRQMRTVIDYKDIQDPQMQQEMLALSGVEPNPTSYSGNAGQGNPQPQQPPQK